ncbi:MAG TPA: hypothetical protein VJ743_02680 [Albitalea sp.]|nr:hypothetical protein [Albitalea sp.]
MSARLGLRRLASLALALVLAGCGGGGSDAPPPPPPPSASFDVAAAAFGIATASEVFTLYGDIAGTPATLEAAHTALPDAAFSSFGILNRFRRTATLTAAGAVTTSYEDDYLDLASHLFYGLIDSAGNQAIASTHAPYPFTATIGMGGLLYDSVHYDSTGVAAGRTHTTWSLEQVPGSVTAAYLCINTDFQDLNGVSTGDREYDCYAIATDGRRLGMRITFVSPSFGAVVFQ